MALKLLPPELAGMLLAQPFGVEKLRAEGAAFPIMDSVRGSPAPGTALTVADFSLAAGALAYRLVCRGYLCRNLQPVLNPNSINVIQNWMAGLKG